MDEIRIRQASHSLGIGGMRGFLKESNAIEGIDYHISDLDLQEAWHFLCLEKITVPDLERFVEHFQPGAKLRDKPGMDVRVGNHVPMRGGPQIYHRLRNIINEMQYKSGHHSNYIENTKFYTPFWIAMDVLGVFFGSGKC